MFWYLVYSFYRTQISSLRSLEFYQILHASSVIMLKLLHHKYALNMSEREIASLDFNDWHRAIEVSDKVSPHTLPADMNSSTELCSFSAMETTLKLYAGKIYIRRLQVFKKYHQTYFLQNAQKRLRFTKNIDLIRCYRFSLKFHFLCYLTFVSHVSTLWQNNVRLHAAN